MGDAEERAAAQEELDSSVSRQDRVGKVPHPDEMMVALGGGGRLEDGYRMRKWTAGQTSQALHAFQELPGGERVTAAQAMSGSMTYLPLELGSAVARELLSAGLGGDEAAAQKAKWTVPSLARTWVDAEPAAAARWVESLPAGEMRDKTAREVLTAWRVQEPEEAARWASGWDGLPEEGMREEE